MTRICVIGAGVEGRDIALTLARSAMSVTVVDGDPGRLRAAQEAVTNQLHEASRTGSLCRVMALAVGESIEFSRAAIAAYSEADVIIDTSGGDAEATRALLGAADRAAPDRTIIISTSTCLSPTVMGAWTNRPDRLLSVHLVAPNQRAVLVEVIRGMETSRFTVSRVEALAGMLDAEVAIVNDHPGFVTGRIEAVLANEAFHLLGEGVATASDIDRVARIRLDQPLGPLELSDAVGLDVRLAALQHLHVKLGERFRPAHLLEQYVSAGRLGRVSGRGVFDYPPAS